MKNLLRIFTAIAVAFGISGCGIYENGTPVSEIPEGSNLAVHYIDVGQADCALVLCDDNSMLIDGGNADDSRLVASYLKNMGIEELDYVVCTHAHEDHAGGLAGALSVADAKHVYAPKREANTKAYKNFKKKALEKAGKIEHPSVGETVYLGSGTVEFLGPVTEKNKDTNSTSIVLKITYGATSFLFTGDAERDEEEDILNNGANLKSTVLKVGHHGSSASTSYPFLRAVMPQYAVISCEKGNSYGHPHRETMSRLNDAEIEIYRTDEQGNIVMTSDGSNITVVTER